MRKFLSLAALLLCVSGLAQSVKVTNPKRCGMDPDRLSLVDGVIEGAIREGAVPGAVLSVVRGDRIVYLKAYGNKSVVPDTVKMTVETMFDLASLSKCVGTTLSFMQLIENGQVRLTDNVDRYIPGFKPWTDPQTGETVDITVRDLMTHSSGIAAYYDANRIVQRFGANQPDSLMRVIATEVRRYFRPGTGFLYSCLNFITLQHILENVTGQRLCDYAAEHVFAPLGLQHTCYFPLQDDLRTPAEHADLLPLVAPTAVQADGTPLLGAVHDPLARLANGGNSGNAGVFSNAEDLSRICMAIMDGGGKILSPAAVELMCTIPPENDPAVGRALGWDKKSPHSGPRGDLFDPDTTLEHTGYTGTSIVIDRKTKTAVILLTHRVHPVDEGGVGRMRAQVANIVASSLKDWR
jgi:CubicO group peptidase (beta-lactamase class C family)